MNPNEPTRTAPIIARQRIAHQQLDHGSILDDPFAMKILREDEKDVLQFAKNTPWPASDVCLPPREAGLRKMLCQELSKEGFGRSSSLAPNSTLSHSGIPMAHLRSVFMRWTTPPRRHGNASVWPKLKSHFRHGLFRASRFRAGRCGRKLAAAGFQQNEPAFFTWLGVVPYLTQDAIGRTLDYISSIQNSEVVFDYMEPPEAFSEELGQLERERTEQLKKMDERSVSRFEPAGIAAILRSHGFCDIEDINFQEIKSRFGGAVQRLAPGQAGLHVVHAKH